ncbi:hypothetical protein [Psychrobacter aquimaris]|uniref:hypothetical protein n=1 Tax=Psychrobacter aquimaris TaxID=292733 RepID=UPI0018E056C6|nr:hypothetical protein [Psychrobacter aquimaris]
MAENPKKDSKTPSMLEISEMVDKIQRQLNPLSFGGKAIDSIMPRMAKYEQMNSAASIADIVSKSVQPVDFASSSVFDHGAMAMSDQLKFPEAMAVQDTFLEMTKGMSAYNNSVMSVRESLIQSTGGTSVYENMMSSVNLIRDSLEPYRSAFDAVSTSFEASEISKLVGDIQSQKAITNSVLSDYADVFKQVESLHNLESFKAITRLKNFPFEDMVRIDLDSIPDLEENISETIVELDSEISDELSLVDDFNELSEERRTVLLGLYQVYYYPIILNCLFILMWLQVFLDEKLDLTKNTFIFVEKSKEKLSYISNVYRPNPSAMIDNFVVGGSLMLLAKILGW